MRRDRTVFVGSTFRDLEHHRRALIDALHDLVWLRVMESRNAAAGTALQNCLRWMRDSHLYVGILGMCYGSREPTSCISFTELEYDEAMRLGLPCLVYLMDEDRHPLMASSVDRGKDAEDLARFKAKVSDANHRALFKSLEDLRYKVVRDIILLFDDLGWWAPQSHDTKPDEARSEGNHWRVQLCAWASPDGILDLGGKPPEVVNDQADLAASLLVSRFARGMFADLRGVITLRADIRNALRLLLSVRDIDEDALSAEIRVCEEAKNVRLLIDIAGLAGSRCCVDAICDRGLRDGRRLNQGIQELGYEMRSFYRVISEALGRMPPSCAPILVGYVEKARAGKKWHAKHAFEEALRRMNGDRQKPGGQAAISSGTE